MDDDEGDLLAVCFANLKGPRKKDLMKTARALAALKAKPKYGTNAKVGKATGVSGEIVREFLTLLELPLAVQDLLDQRQLTLEQGRRLWQLRQQRPDLVEEAARTMVGLTATDSRHMVEYMLRHPEMPAETAKRDILASKTQINREFHVVALLSEEQYKSLRVMATKRGVPVNDMVTDIVTQWLSTGHYNAR